jgi:hypothetical protein
MATTTVFPDGEVATGSWTTTGANHWSVVDEDTDTPNTSDYIETTTVSDTVRFTIAASPANTSEVTAFDVNLHAFLTDVSATSRYRINVYATGPGELTGSPKFMVGADFGGYGNTPAKSTSPAQFSGNMGGSGTGGALTKAEFDSLEIEVTHLET